MTCSTLRPANAAYCPKCGSPFQEGRPRNSASSEPPTPVDDLGSFGSIDYGPTRTSVDLSPWTGVKLGIGFAIGVALVGLILTIVVVFVLRIDVPGSRF
jgi:hypothetical protein